MLCTILPIIQQSSYMYDSRIFQHVTEAFACAVHEWPQQHEWAQQQNDSTSTGRYYSLSSECMHDKEWTTIPVLCHYHFTTIPVLCHYRFSTISELCHYHFTTIAVTCQYHFTTVSLSFSQPFHNHF